MLIQLRRPGGGVPIRSIAEIDFMMFSDRGGKNIPDAFYLIEKY